MRTRAATRSGCRLAYRETTSAPNECPTSTAWSERVRSRMIENLHQGVEVVLLARCERALATAPLVVGDDPGAVLDVGQLGIEEVMVAPEPVDEDHRRAGGGPARDPREPAIRHGEAAPGGTFGVRHVGRHVHAPRHEQESGDRETRPSLPRRPARAVHGRGHHPTTPASARPWGGAAELGSRRVAPWPRVSTRDTCVINCHLVDSLAPSSRLCRRVGKRTVRPLLRRIITEGVCAMNRRTGRSVVLLACVAVAVGPRTLRAAEPLPSWNDGEAKQSILRFVESVTREGAPTFVPPPERIAVFDNDGTLWAEQPLYFQFVFALDQVKALAPKHPGVEEPAAVQRSSSQATPRGARRRGSGPGEDPRGVARGNDDRRVRGLGRRVDSDGAPPAL